MALKSIFEYSDYRELIRDLFRQKKARDKKFSYRYFAKSAGFVSHSFLQFVMEGKSELSNESIHKFIKGFNFNKDEAHFFAHLVLFNQAKTSTEKQAHAEEIFRCKGYRKIYPLSESQFNFYSNWYFIPVREIVGFSNFVEDLEWISKSVVPQITVEQTKRALDELQKLGLLQRNHDGKLVQSNPNLSTADEVSSSAISKWHREMMKKASESIDITPRDERDISAVTLGMSKESSKKVKELLQKFRKDLVELVSGDSVDSVYQLNLHFFPLAKAQAKRGDK